MSQRRSTRILSLALLTASLAGLIGCAPDRNPPSVDDSQAPSGRLVVFAAASLTASLEDLAEEFTASNPSVDLVFSFAASGELVAQIEQGAPADVIATADTATMDRLNTAGLLGSPPTIFALNSLEIITAPGNPLAVKGLADLSRDDLVVVRCNPSVPCGAYADRALDAADVAVNPASLESNVKAVVTKVTSGEADAGIVYATDVKSAGSAAQGVAIDPAFNVRAEYPVAVIADAANPRAAAAFAEFLRSPAGIEVLRRNGFVAP